MNRLIIKINYQIMSNSIIRIAIDHRTPIVINLILIKGTITATITIVANYTIIGFIFTLFSHFFFFYYFVFIF